MRLSADNLACTRGGRRVLAGISFTVEAGAALILEGPNGAGKSTLLRLIAGLIQPDSGAVTLEGGDGELGIGQQCHHVGHLDALKLALTVRENVEFWASFLGGGEVERALAAVKLDHLADLPAGLLSAGQKRRLALARLAAVPRPMWLLDEPTVSLDRAAKAELEAACAGHLAGGGLIVAATHQELALTPAQTLTLGGSGE